jgi:hypothetical protein
MNPRVKTVRPNPDHTLTLVFDNGETRRFDVTPYLEKGIFQALREMRNFNSVKVFLGSVQWRGGQDLCPDTLYMDSTPVSESFHSSEAAREEVVMGVAEP